MNFISIKFLLLPELKKNKLVTNFNKIVFLIVTLHLHGTPCFNLILTFFEILFLNKVGF